MTSDPGPLTQAASPARLRVSSKQHKQEKNCSREGNTGAILEKKTQKNLTKCSQMMQNEPKKAEMGGIKKMVKQKF